MAVKIIMPKQGLQMTEGLITAWLAGEGDAVKAGEPLFEMETDKLAITIDSPASGTLLKIVAPEGASVPITETIAIVGEPGEDISDLLRDGGVVDGQGGDVSGAPREGGWQGGARSEDVTGMPHSSGAGQSGDASGATREGVSRGDAISSAPRDGDGYGNLLSGARHSGGGRILISPRAKRLAVESGLDWHKLSGSAPGGMIVERDVLAVIAAAQETASPAKKTTPDPEPVAAGAEQPTDRERQYIEPMSNMRSIIAKRLRRSLCESAQAVHRISVLMDEAVRLRESRNKTISYNDIIAFATIRALLDFPAMNAEWTDGGILHKNYVNLSIAVALEHGLIAPVIKNAHLMTLNEISVTIKTLAQKAKENRLAADDCAGGSFTVSNLGMYGLDEFTAIINPPESGILAVGKISDTPVAIDGKVEIRKVVKLTLTYDHRVIDGAPAAQFLSRVKDYLETPYLLL